MNENMKVKITYTVELEQVPEAASKVLDRALSPLEGFSDKVDKLKAIKDVSVDKTIKQIEEIRKSMYEAELLLSDSSNMLMGYLNTISAKEEADSQENHEG